MREAHALYGAIQKVVEQRRAAGSEGDYFVGQLLRAEFEGERLDDDPIVLDPDEAQPAIVGMMMRSPARLPVVWD